MTSNGYISDTDLVRRLARNVPTNDFSDEQIIFEQKSAYSKIFNKMHIDWENLADPTDKRLPGIAKIEEQLAAAYVLQHYGSGSPDELNMIAALMQTAKEDLQEVVDEGTDIESDFDILFATSDYEAYPGSLADNQNAIPYRSTSVSF